MTAHAATALLVETETLTASDLAMFAVLGVPEHVVRDAGIRRVTHAEAREVCGITLKSEHLEGIAFPFLDPEDDAIRDWTVRRDNPEQEADGRPIAKYVNPPGRRHLYFRCSGASHLTDTTCPVIVVEAPKSALAIDAARLRTNRTPWPLVIATGGCWTWRGVIGKTTSPTGARVDQKGPLPDLDRITWTARDTIIVFDGNVTTKPSVQAARRLLAADLKTRGALVRVVDLPVEAGVNGPDDYIGRHGAAAFWALVDDATPIDSDEDGSDSDRRTKESQATAIVRLAVEDGVVAWHTPSGDNYLTVRVEGHREHYPLNSRASRDYLTRVYYLDAKRAPNASALQDAIATLSGLARIDGDEHDVHVRVAGRDDHIYLDLGDPAWRAVEVSPEGWRVVSDPPVRFRRPRGLLPLPTPVAGGSIAELRPFVNVATDDDFALLVAWELAALRSRGPYPIQIDMAEQGSAKTTTTRVCRRLIDPNESDVRRPPRNTEDLMIAATNGHVVAYDNLSRLPDDLSDNLSVLATGGGFAVRQLYTNGEEHIFNASRPIILNGIAQVATRGDLLDRAIVLTLPTIPDERRVDERTFWATFTEAHPRILGALLDAAVIGLRRLPDVQLPRKPRMADFALWAVACEPGCPWPAGTFWRAYAENRQAAVEATLDGDPLADIVRGITPWTGTAADLLKKLNTSVDETVRNRRDWFSKPRQVADALRRLAPGLRRVGIDVVFTKEGRNRTRVIQIEKVGAGSSAPSASSVGAETGEFSGVTADEGRTQADESSADSSARKSPVSNGVDAADAADAVKPTSTEIPTGDTWLDM